MISLNYVLLLAWIMAIANCGDRAPPSRYQLFGSPSKFRITTSTTTTTTKPTTTSTLPPTTTTKAVNRISPKFGPYNIYAGLDFILPMLGNTKPTTSTPSSTTPIGLNPIVKYYDRLNNNACTDKNTCPTCPNYNDSICCYKTVKDLKRQGRCKCTSRVDELNTKCD